MRRYGPVAVAASLAAVGVFVLLLPTTVNESDPPECFSLFGYAVPCGGGSKEDGFALAGAVLAAVLVLLGWAVAQAQRGRHDGA